MLTKSQKKDEVKAGVEALQKSRTVMLVDFGGLPTADLRKLRTLVREFQGKVKVIKKRLLRIVFERSKVALDPTMYEAQVGTIFLPLDIYATAGKIQAFIKSLIKEKKELKLLAAYDVQDHIAFTVEEFVTIAKLPTREVLLAHIAMMLTVPVKKMLIVLNSRKEKLAK
jgi:ribosomal protein L10